MKKGTTSGNKDAFAMFPDVLANVSKSKQPGKDKISIAPPSPPDISWLKAGSNNGDSNQTTDVPTALVLMAGKERNFFVSKVLKESGYLVESVDTPLQAIERVQFSNISVLIQHTDFEAGTLLKSVFYDYLKKLPMKKRRYIFYMLTGPDFHTLYDLEALSNSANLVVNDRDLKHLKVILRKSFHNFEDLFGNLINALDGSRHL